MLLHVYRVTLVLALSLEKVEKFLLFFPNRLSNVPIDFETTGNGAGWNWTVFENTINPPLEIIDDPDKSGINTSCTVAQITALQTGNPWAGCESMHGADLPAFMLDANTSTINIMV